MNLIMKIVAIFWCCYAFLIVCGAVLCAAYSRYCKKRNIMLVTKTDSPKSENKKRGNSILSKTGDYCSGLCRYYSILIGKIPSNRIRKFLLRNIFCMKIAQKAVVYGGFEIRYPWNIELGECVVGVNALLDGRYGIVICDGVCLSQNVSIYTCQHDVNDQLFRINNKCGTVRINEMAWISSRTTILHSVQVGKGAVLAAGGIATKNLEPFGIYAGIPAKKIADRNKEINYRVVDGYWHFY